MTDRIFEGKTLEEALCRAEEALGKGRDALAIEVLEETEKGMLGLKWGKRVSIRAAERSGTPSASPAVRGTASVPADTGAAARETMARLLTLSGLQGEIAVEETDEEILLTVRVGEEEESLFIGRKGKNLDAYQYLLGKLLEDRSGAKGKRIVLDCADYRARRRSKLEEMARQAAGIVRTEGRSYAFPPMPANERRIIHMTLKEEGLLTESRGTGEEKKVVAFPPDPL